MLNHAEKSSLILLALSISSFCIGTAEFVMAGVLPEIAATFHVSIPMTGWLMTGYAAGVFISSPFLTAATMRLSRKHVLLSLMALFVLGNFVSAIAPSYSILMLGRIVSSLCHGAFFGIASIVAAESVSPDKKSRAIALMFTGLTLANVVGVPLGTFLGQHFGWRSLFWVITLLGLIAIIGLTIWLPNQKCLAKSNLQHELMAFKTPQVWLSLLVTAMGFAGVFACFGFMAPMMVHVAGFLKTSIPYLLTIFGIGLVIGNVIGGAAADRKLLPALFLFLTLLCLTLFVFVITAHQQILATITLFAVGVFGFAIVSPVQTQVIHHAKKAPTLASSVNIAAFNLGIAMGTYFAGLAIHLGFGFASPNWVGGIFVLVALLLQAINVMANRL